MGMVFARAAESPWKHLSTYCGDTTDRWRDLRFLTEELSCHIPHANCFIDTVDAAFRGQDLDKLVPFTLLTKATWLDRNQVTYAQQRAHTPVGITLRFAVEVLNSLWGKLDPTMKSAKKLETVGKMLQIAASRAGESEHTTELITQDREVEEDVVWDGEGQVSHSQASNHGDEELENTYFEEDDRVVESVQGEGRSQLRVDA
ncbi:hypothetical protein R1flu_000474 [Riccia fluitans]|uniref:Transposase n=1 Tax=Riccia fluitans TaxID=41844 RepID=A0ABD1Y4P9_9MARC